MKTFKIVAGDLALGADGGVTLVTGRDKLVQDTLECILVDTNDEGYGAGLGELIGSVQGNISADIALRILTALEFYQRLQQQQPSVSESEKLKQIVNIQSDRVAYGSRTDYNFSLHIKNGVDPQPIKLCLLPRPPLV